MQLADVLYQMMAQSAAAGQPAELCIGTVSRAAPLEITIDPAMPPLPREVLYLTDAVRDHSVDITVSWFTENDAFMNGSHTHNITDTYTGGGSCGEGNLDTTHRHAVKGKKSVTVHNNLAAGEAVLLLRVQHGQKFVVLSRLEK